MKIIRCPYCVSHHHRGTTHRIQLTYQNFKVGPFGKIGTYHLSASVHTGVRPSGGREFHLHLHDLGQRTLQGGGHSLYTWVKCKTVKFITLVGNSETSPTSYKFACR